MKREIRISRNCHGNLNCTLYGINETSIRNFFCMIDVWNPMGSLISGYDRFNDDGIYYEIPLCMYDVIENLPFIHGCRINVIKE